MAVPVVVPDILRRSAWRGLVAADVLIFYDMHKLIQVVSSTNNIYSCAFALKFEGLAALGDVTATVQLGRSIF